MLLSYVIYSGLAIALFYLAKHAVAHERNGVTSGRKTGAFGWELILSVLLFAAIAGARWHTGYDHASYVTQYLTFQNYHFFTRSFEPLFLVLTEAFAGLGLHYFFYFFFLAALEIAAIYWALVHHKKILPWLAVILMMGPLFVHLMNTVRQGFVECCVPLVVALLYDRSRWKAVIVILLLSGMHYSALLLLMLLPFHPRKMHINKALCVSLFVIAVVLSVYPIWLNNCICYLQEIMSKFSSAYATQLGEMVSQEVKLAHFGPIKLVLLASQFATIWLGCDAVKRYGNSHAELSMFFVLAMIFVIGTNLLSNTSCFIQRPFELFSICYLIIAGYSVFLLYDTHRKTWALALLAVHCSYVFLAVFKAVYHPDPVTVPILYHFFFI